MQPLLLHSCIIYLKLIVMYYTEPKYQLVGAMCLHTAVQLGIPDKVSNHGRPITLPELATALHLHPNRNVALNQLMRFLVFKGLFSTTIINEEDAYVLAPSSHLFLSDIETTISTAMSSPPSVLGLFEPFHAGILKAWKHLGNWFLGDEPITPFKFAHGISFWEYIKETPDGHTLHETMEIYSKKFIESSDLKTCLAAFEGLGSMVDVGGGTGALAKAISETYPHMECIVLDLPQVSENMPPPTQGNLRYVGGDMFHCIPPAEGVLMKWILHNWSDEKCHLILKNCKDALSQKGKQGKMIIIDDILNQENDGQESAAHKFIRDMMMMLLFNGKERTEPEWKKLIVEAGFSHYKIIPLLDFRSLIEVFP